MKKLLLVAALTFTSFGVMAQSNTEDRELGTTTKNGQKILPQAGDFAFGIDALSFLQYAGNMFNGNTDNEAPHFVYTTNGGAFDGAAIFGKYYLADDRAIRAKVNIGFGTNTARDLVSPSKPSDNADPLNPEFVENKTKTKTNGLGLTAGYEFRRGYGRLQGYFGPEVGLGFQSSSTVYEYGNDMNQDYIDAGGDLSRATKTANGTTFSMKAGGFAGVEYFIAPKIALGAEVGLGFQFDNTSKGFKETENWKDDQVKKGKADFIGTKDDKNGINLGAAYSASINLIFHF